MSIPSWKQWLMFGLVALLALAACGSLRFVGEEPGGYDEAAAPPFAEATVDYNCTDENPHPIGQGIADKYDTPYQQVMTWFCSGYSFDNIMIALETSDAMDIPVDTLLEMLLEKEWEEIWNEIGFTNNP
jgi:hypothetical protein